MKRDHRKVVMALLLIVTTVVLGWAILLVAKGVDLLAMFHVAAPSSAAYRVMLKDACADSQKLLYFAVIPLAVMTILWMMAFLRERRKNNILEAQLRQQKGGGASL
jgi:hypothetical protein